MSWRATIAGAVLLAGLLAACTSFENPKNVVISIEAPLRAKLGEKFEIKARVKNTAANPQTLVSLDVGEEYLRGVAIERTDPPFVEATHIPLDNTMSYSYDLKLESQEEKVITLHASALKKGDHASEVDFCINTDYSFLSYPIRTLVE